MRMGIAAALLLVGSIATADPSAAALTKACMAKHANACIDLAAMGSRAGLDLTGVITWHREACNLGDDRGCFLLATDLRAVGSVSAAVDGKAIFAKLCAANRPDACDQLGDMSPLGAKRVLAYGQACSLGDADGCEMLVKIYLRKDPSADTSVSTQALEALCESGTAYACRFAAERYPASPGEAELLMGKACDLDDDDACGFSDRSSSSAGWSHGRRPRSPSAR
jgi:hypothetical protein